MAGESDTDTLLEATTALLPPLLTALEALAHAGRHLHPPDLAELVAGMGSFRTPLDEGLATFDAVSWPAHLGAFEERCRLAAEAAQQALISLADSLEQDNPVMGAYRAMGFATRAVESLYPVAFMLPPVNRFYLCEPQRADQAFQAAMLAADPNRDDVGVGHAGSADERGGFSLYVPEYRARSGPAPLVVALHGGSGHGRRFLWTWLREARSRGAIVLCPTSQGGTWSLAGPDVDTPALLEMVARVQAHFDVDPTRVLLTGMSDGGTFAYLCGLQEASPFTHLAPISASFHPMLVEVASGERLRGLPIYLVHGALDWMFDVEMARLARDTLTAAGAAVTYRELDDLSHTYPREENVRMLEWLGA